MINSYLPKDKQVKFEDIWVKFAPDQQSEIERFLREKGLDKVLDKVTPEQIQEVKKVIDSLRGHFGWLG